MARKKGDRLAYFQFFPQDFTSDGKVEVMSTEQVGAYLLLMCKAWHEQPPASIPNDDAILARWARVPSSRWKAIRDGVLSAWQLREDNRYHQKRLGTEHAAAMVEYARKSSGATATNASRWGDGKQSNRAGSNPARGADTDSATLASVSPPVAPQPESPDVSLSDRLAISKRSHPEPEPYPEPNPPPSPPPVVDVLGPATPELKALAERQSAVRKYMAAHPRLMWSPKDAADLEFIVEKAGWDRMAQCLETALKQGAGRPCAYARGVYLRSDDEGRMHSAGLNGNHKPRPSQPSPSQPSKTKW